MLRHFVFAALCVVMPLVCSGQTKGTAVSANEVSTAVKKLDVYLRKIMRETKVPGAAVAIIYRDQVILLKGYGVRKLGNTEEVDPDTVFELASLSKPISATVLASLMGKNGVGWDVRVKDLDPEFKLSDAAASEEVTLRDLFSHRSGLPTGAGDVLEDLGYTRPEIRHRMRLVPIAGEFRKTYHYSNFGLTEGAVAVSKKLRIPWEKLAEQELYSKLGMSSTSSRFSDYENSPNKAAIHVADCDSENHCVFRNQFVRNADAESPAGGVSSSVRDLSKWMRLQLAGGSLDGQQIINRKALEETRKAEICKSVDLLPPGKECPQGSYYGLGWGANTTSWGSQMSSHSGAFLLGTGTAVYLVPSEQIGIVVLSNGAPVGLPEATALTFLDYFHYGAAKEDYLRKIGPFFEALRQEAQDSSPNYSVLVPLQNGSSGKALSEYTGRYFNSFYGTLEVRLERGQLILLLPPREAYYELKHWDGDIFTYYFASENTGIARRGVKFSEGQILVENLAIENSGVFKRVK